MQHSGAPLRASFIGLFADSLGSSQGGGGRHAGPHQHLIDLFSRLVSRGFRYLDDRDVLSGLKVLHLMRWREEGGGGRMSA